MAVLIHFSVCDLRATVNSGNGNRNGNGNGNGNGKGSSKLPAAIVVQLKMEEIYGWYGPYATM